MLRRVLVEFALLAVSMVLPTVMPAQTTTTNSPIPPGLTAVPKPTPMPTFNLPEIGGKTVRSVDLRGKVLVLRLWATW